MPASQVKGLFAAPAVAASPPLPPAPVATPLPTNAFAFDSGAQPGAGC